MLPVWRNYRKCREFICWAQNSLLKCNIGAARKNIKTLSLSQIEKCKLGNHSKSDLNEEKVKEIREYLKTNRQRDAVKEFNISRFAISRIVTGKSFSYIE